MKLRFTLAGTYKLWNPQQWNGNGPEKWITIEVQKIINVSLPVVLSTDCHSEGDIIRKNTHKKSSDSKAHKSIPKH